MAKRRKVTTAQRAAAMSSAERAAVYRKEYRRYKDHLRKALKLGADISGFRNFPTPAAFRSGTPIQQARILGSLSSYSAEVGTGQTIYKRQQSLYDALKNGGYGPYFDDLGSGDESNFSQSRFGRFMEAARAAWEGGRRTFPSDAVVTLYGIMEQNNYSIRMFIAYMKDLLEGVLEGTINADNADIAGKSSRARTMERTAEAFREWGIQFKL